MFTKISSFVFTLALARAAFADLALLTPTLTQCKEAKLEWSGGAAGYALFVIPYNDPCGDAAVEFPHTSQNSLSWNVTLPAGAKVDLMVEDADANEAWTGTITVGNSDDTSCIDSKAVSVLKAAGALAATESSPTSAASSASSASQESSGASIYASPFAGTPAGAAGSYPTSGSSSPDSSSSDSSDGVANAASPDTSQTSASIPRTQAAGSIISLAVLFFAMLQL